MDLHVGALWGCENRGEKLIGECRSLFEEKAGSPPGCGSEGDVTAVRNALGARLDEGGEGCVDEVVGHECVV